MRTMRALAVVSTTVLMFACSSSEPAAELDTPSALPSTTPEGLVEPTPTAASASLEDKNCDDFATQGDAQSFYVEAGGPEQDLHGLDADRNGRACDEIVATASPASAAGAAQAVPLEAAPSPANAVASPQHHTQVSGDVDGPEGGSSRYESCETDGDERCGR